MELILKSLCVVVFLGSALYVHAATQESEPSNENDEVPEPQVGESASEGGDFGKKFNFHRLRLQPEDSGSKREYSPVVGKELSPGPAGGIGVGGDKGNSTEKQKNQSGQLGKKPGNPIEKINIDRISQQTGSIVSKKEYSPMVRKELPTTQSVGAQVGDNKEESTERQNYQGSHQGKKSGYPSDKLNIDRRSQQTDGSTSRKKYSWEEVSTGQSGSSEVGRNKGESAGRQKHQVGQQEKKPSYRRGYKRPEERQESVEESTEHKEPESSTRRYSRKGHARNSNSERSSSS